MLPMPELSDYDSLEEIAAVLTAYGISDYCFRFAEDYRDSNVNTVAVQSSNVLAAAQNPNAGIPVLPGSVHVDVYLGEQIKSQHLLICQRMFSPMQPIRRLLWF